MQAIGLLIFARTLGPSEYSIIVAATAVAAVATEFVGLGAGDLLIREVSRDPSSHRSAFGRALRLVALTIVPVTVLATIVADLWFRTGTSFGVLLVLVASEIIATRMVFMTEQIAIAQHETHAANANRIFATVVRLTVICIAVFVAGISTAVDWAPFAIASAIFAASGCLIMSVRRFGPPDLRAPFSRELQIGVMFSLMQIVRAAQFSIDKFAVGSLASSATVGSFGVASRAAQFGIMPASAVTRITYPMFFARGALGLNAAVEFARRISLPILAIGLVSSVALAGLAYILPILLGPSFGPTRPFLLIMALLPLAASLQNLGGSILSGADYQTQRVVAMTCGLILTWLAIFLGSRTGGVSGAVVGYMIGQFLAAAVMFAPIPILRRLEKLSTGAD
jgi:O-antigen/teichoic acid export membrane protein